MFGVCLDPLTSARPDVLAQLCAEYAAAAAVSDGGGDFAGGIDQVGSNDIGTDDSVMERTTCRVVRRVNGTPVPAALLTPLRCALPISFLKCCTALALLQHGWLIVI